jgi:hypothetical protein
MSDTNITVIDPIRARFKDAPWFKKIDDLTVMVGGAGGIGSWTSFLLARAGFGIVTYDFDIIEEHNIGGQLYPRGNIGQSKINALEELISEFSDTNIVGFNEAIDVDSPTHPFVVAAFDNMKAREIMFNSWVQMFGLDDTAIFIDGRLEAEFMKIYCVRGNDIPAQEKYRSELFTDAEVPDAPCTMRQTSHAAAMIASHIVGFFTNHITNVVEGEQIRRVPFSWEYFIPIDLLTLQEVGHDRVNTDS